MNQFATFLLVVAAIVVGFFILKPGKPASPTPQAVKTDVPLYENMGTHQFTITTKNKLVQRYFNQGLALTYGFNHEEAGRAFKQAFALDPTCAMCYWGAAYGLGPNINAPMEKSVVAEAYALSQKALALAPTASEKERALIEALSKRYAQNPPDDRSALDKAYADAMREVAKHFSDDADVVTLFGESLMDLTPWNYWTKEGIATTYTTEIVTTLESALKLNPNHPGANHYYIHAVEASEDNERAIPSAERLAKLGPAAGHLVHMPAHTYWRVGRYQDAALANEHAIHSDELYAPDRSTPNWYLSAYYPHNIHFLFAATAMQGQSALAIKSARKLIAEIPESSYQQLPPLEDFLPTPLFALIRFGKWEEILIEPQPRSEFQYTTGIWHYARGMALLRTGKPDEALGEWAKLDELSKKPEMEAFGLASFSTAATNLRIASLTLGAELAEAQGEKEKIISQLEEAVKLQDGLAYIEPPAWYYPVRQTLGAALLKQGKATEAEAVYRQDLKQYPKNGWSLFGLMKSLETQGKTQEMNEAKAEFEKAWSHADIALTMSQF
jgi:tetratricopeptide (TPR) repeat protein